MSGSSCLFVIVVALVVPALIGGFTFVVLWFVLMDHTAWSVVDITPVAAVAGLIAGVAAFVAVNLGGVTAWAARWTQTTDRVREATRRPRIRVQEPERTLSRREPVAPVREQERRS